MVAARSLCCFFQCHSLCPPFPPFFSLRHRRPNIPLSAKIWPQFQLLQGSPKRTVCLTHDLQPKRYPAPLGDPPRLPFAGDVVMDGQTFSWNPLACFLPLHSELLRWAAPGRPSQSPSFSIVYLPMPWPCRCAVAAARDFTPGPVLFATSLHSARTVVCVHSGHLLRLSLVESPCVLIRTPGSLWELGLCVCGDGGQALREEPLGGREFVWTVEFEVPASRQGRCGWAASTWETGPWGGSSCPGKRGKSLGSTTNALGRVLKFREETSLKGEGAGAQTRGPGLA